MSKHLGICFDSRKNGEIFGGRVVSPSRESFVIIRFSAYLSKRARIHGVMDRPSYI